MLHKALLYLALALSSAQDAIDNGAEPFVVSAAPVAGLEKRRIIGWTTRWVTYHEGEDEHGGCHHPRPPCNTETIFVVPSTVTEVKSETIFTYQTIPVPPCPCEVPDCRQNGCHGCSQVKPCNSCYKPSNGCNSCHSCGGGSIISTSTIPYTTPAPASSVIVLSTKTSSVTIYTQSSPASNDASSIANTNFSALLLAFIATAMFMIA